MANTYNEDELDEKELSCDSCGWKGKGSDTNIIDLYGIASTQEIHCPNCDNYIGNLKTSRDQGGPADELSFQTG